MTNTKRCCRNLDLNYTIYGGRSKENFVGQMEMLETEAKNLDAKTIVWSEQIKNLLAAAKTSGNPVILQHPIFADFFEDCEIIIPNNVDYNFVLAVTESIADMYKDEDTRGENLNDNSKNITISALINAQTKR
ncbi:826_t:CDS:2 [Ambispora leptoticha]|uniref:826_t:CDS:1 n=1 Tax=Ambispora leptoticha TaxID=144679 RepID=A0A9N9ENC1_9GLOM|nr:826_t:CDS:2 [Ambispora leptoticha]